jgi:O-succinylbenzoate synthase
VTVRLRWRTRTYPLTRPLRVGDAPLTERKVMELQLDDRWAEASPLPGLHRESLGDLVPLLPAARERLVDLTGTFGEKIAALAADDAWQALPPSLRCALEGALLESVDDLERPVAPMPPTCRLLDQGPDDPLDGVVGAGCVKLKIGRRDPAAEQALVRRVQSMLPAGGELRLDANRAFTLDEAVTFAAGIDDAPGFIEEPLRDPRDLPEFWRRTGWPVALDETLHDPAHADLRSNEAVAAWVIKPALLGLAPTLALFDAAPEHVACVVSSSFEGLVGLGLLMELAEVAPGHPAPGLGTVDWLAGDGRTSRWTVVR